MFAFKRWAVMTVMAAVIMSAWLPCGACVYAADAPENVGSAGCAGSEGDAGGAGITGGIDEENISDGGAGAGRPADDDTENGIQDREEDVSGDADAAGGEDAAAGEDTAADEVAVGDSADDADVEGPGEASEHAAPVRSMRGAGTARLIVSCNVTGCLGDLSRRFAFVVRLSGLEPDTEYPIIDHRADLISGFSGEGFVSDGDGNAVLSLRISDQDSIEMPDLPLQTVFEVIEAACDHEPSYLVTSTKEGIASGSGPPRAALSTGRITMGTAVFYTADFTNHREPAPVTGLDDGRSMPGLLLAIIVLMLLGCVCAWRGSRSVI